MVEKPYRIKKNLNLVSKRINKKKTNTESKAYPETIIHTNKGKLTD